MLKISCRCAALTFLVSFSITIFALRGAEGLRLGERDLDRESDRERFRLLLLERLRERERDLFLAPLGGSLERLPERELAPAAGGVWRGVGERRREGLRSRGGEDIVRCGCYWCMLWLSRVKDQSMRLSRSFTQCALVKAWTL